jgi:hypothetical protein
LQLPVPLPEPIVAALALDEPVRGACSIHAAEGQRIEYRSASATLELLCSLYQLLTTTLSNNRFVCLKLFRTVTQL